MRFLEKLERKLRPYAIPNLTYWLIIAQVFGFVISITNPHAFSRLIFDPQLILHGEIWRLVSCIVAVPPIGTGFGLLFYFFFLYLFYIMGTALENEWGSFRYNVYVLISFLSMLIVGFATLSPQMHVAGWIKNTVFLAFAYLFPDFTLLLFFILPVKVKYLAMLSWFFIGYRTLLGDWTALASVCNFFLYFGRQIASRIRSGKRKMQARAKEIQSRNKPFHICQVCGATEKSHPDMEFRYCSKCADENCYCMDHILNHEHTVKQSANAPDRPDSLA